MKTKIWSSHKADIEFSRFIRARDKFCYFKCGREAKQASHFWGRGNSATRYCLLNVDGVCGKCHMENEGNKQGKYRELKIKQLGEQGYAELERKARSVVKRHDAIIACMKLLDIHR